MSSCVLDLEIRPSTIQEEFKYLNYILQKTEFYEKNGYLVSYPEVAELKNPSIVKDPNRMLHLLESKEYDMNFYSRGVAILTEKKEEILRCMHKIYNLQNYWDFKVFPKYTVILTKYGPGGSYDTTNAKITMLTFKDGGFKRKNPHHTVVHEMVHIGIEEPIVKKYELSHWEKERVVDYFIHLYLKDEIPDYMPQRADRMDIDLFIKDPTRLPEEICAYKESLKIGG